MGCNVVCRLKRNAANAGAATTSGTSFLTTSFQCCFFRIMHRIIRIMRIIRIIRIMHRCWGCLPDYSFGLVPKVSRKALLKNILQSRNFNNQQWFVFASDTVVRYFRKSSNAVTEKAKQQLQNNQISIESQDSIEEKMFTFRENVSETANIIFEHCNWKWMQSSKYRIIRFILKVL